MYKYSLIGMMFLFPTIAYSYNCLDSENYVKPDALLETVHLHNTTVKLSKSPSNELFIKLTKDTAASIRSVIMRAERANNQCATAISFSKQLTSLFAVDAQTAEVSKFTILEAFPECNFYINYTFDLLETHRLAKSFDVEMVPAILALTSKRYRE
ncbi:hypothetical protein V1358_01125 [Pseudoalteromonas sp. YIC-656]|uniref:hypothetical protein n=1 Tax=Pseudoalteromonas pernae TaxID=3118054 RepID=UPI003242E4A9